MTLPNLISVLRLLLVPVIVTMIVSGEDAVAFWLFVVAGLSDAADGIIARRFALYSELGAYLDPIADKALLVSIYLSLGLIGALPVWLVIVVISRDILIVGGVILSWGMGRPVPMHPLMVSKANTMVQIMLAAIVLAEAGLELSTGGLRLLLVYAVALTTIVSAASYVVDWFAHMAVTEKNRARETGKDGIREGTNE
ncbi:CDP-alcohol phosphatidyltransferase family protein [Breoghania sp.]|uniref:CDP-alcohol phosphatidyltransferase family protein n=1 Tax=Breoghania sp. TaxID=2065378 RepID=UPI002638BF84|nr:CDP-alcohol phosphatidyltransferase family protein [Breoghania sp.]MDJ0929638.1 CDP-alcohol phosphatidyltransferase family protein [Breoghania sp.]